MNQHTAFVRGVPYRLVETPGKHACTACGFWFSKGFGHGCAHPGYCEGTCPGRRLSSRGDMLAFVREEAEEQNI